MVVAGLIYFSTNTGVLFMLIVSLERAMGVLAPHFFANDWSKVYASKVRLVIWFLMVAIFGLSFADDFSSDPIPVCLPISAVGFYS